MAPPYRVSPVPGNPKLLDTVRDVIRDRERWSKKSLPAFAAMAMIGESP